jgi:hypothetical protein
VQSFELPKKEMRLKKTVYQPQKEPESIKRA